MLMTLFDEEQIMKNHDADLTKEVTKEVTYSTNISNIKSIMSKLSYTAEQAMELLNIPSENRDYYKSLL